VDPVIDLRLYGNTPSTIVDRTNDDFDIVRDGRGTSTSF
jgi:tRNA A37 threonylcarbamoyladenosine synthetase subunit TsaC/SUA5/YrdC